MDKLFKQRPYIRYANCHEDPFSLLALYPHNAKTVVSIGSGGDNSFSLLTKSPETVYVVDSEPAQLHLIRLKAEAIKRLDYDELLVFLGVRGDVKSGEAAQAYGRIRDYLPCGTRQYFDARPRIFTRFRVIGCGKFENYLRVFSKKMLPLIHGKRRLQAFMSQTDVEKQWEFYEREINTLRWRKLTKLFFSRIALSRLGRDKAYFKYAQNSLSAAVVSRIERTVQSCLNRDNPFMQLSVFNRFDTLPHYLSKEAYPAVKANLGRLKLIEGDISAVAALPEKIDFFNLSDIFEYMDGQTAEQNEKIILERAATGGRVVFWNMLADREFRSGGVREISTDEVLQKERIFYYGRLLCYEKL